ncbi:MAG: protein kinase [Candidatus Melainabacteria bacterium]|nr:protein kinase [Candidatus Melainabacteria bacterium]
MHDENDSKFKAPPAKLVEIDTANPADLEAPGKDDATSKDLSSQISTTKESFSTSPNLLIGQIIGGHYEIQSVLGEGGISIVYKALHVILGTPVAIKFLLPGTELDAKALMRFQREAQATAELNHPSIAGIREFGIHRAIPYLVLEFVEGQSLAEIIKSENKLEPQRALSLLEQITEALSFAHNRKVVHRDIKPSNIMVFNSKDGREEIKIIDFGVAKVLEGEGQNNLTRTGDVFGTPSYMSPEQCQGINIDYRTDIYAVGCMAYEMFSGAPPFTGSRPIEVIVKHTTEKHKKLKPVKGMKGLNRVIDSALAKDPVHRYQSCDELLLDLNLLEKNETPLGKPLPPSKFNFKGALKAMTIALACFLVFYCWLIYTFQPSGTISSFTTALAKEPSSENYLARAKLYKNDGRYREALSDAAKALAIEPNNFWAFKFRGDVFNELGEWANARAEADKAIAIAPKEYRGYLLRGTALYGLGSYDEAIKDLDKSLELNHDTYIANMFNNRTLSYYYRGCALNELEQYDKALADIELAIKNNPGSLSIVETGDSYKIMLLTARAKAYFGLNRIDAALADAKAALDVDPANEEAKQVFEKASKPKQPNDGATSPPAESSDGAASTPTKSTE